MEEDAIGMCTNSRLMLQRFTNTSWTDGRETGAEV